MYLRKNIKPGKIKILIFFYLFFLILFSFNSFADQVNFVEIKILDKAN